MACSPSTSSYSHAPQKKYLKWAKQVQFHLSTPTSGAPTFSTFSEVKLMEEAGLGKKWEEPDVEVQSEAAMEGRQS